MSYFLLSFALGSGILFPSHVGGNTAATRVTAVRRETAVLKLEKPGSSPGFGKHPPCSRVLEDDT